MRRRIVEIDESKCDGCGECVPACAEGAIALVGGKARVESEALCDGFGVCVGECPRGALSIVERDVVPFDESAAAEHVAVATVLRPRHGVALPVAPHGGPGGDTCPGSRPVVLGRRTTRDDEAAQGLAASSRLGHWPVQLRLVPDTAPFFRGADLLVAADCVPFAYARFHDELLSGRALVVGCPKLDDSAAYVSKLGRILASNDVRSVTVARMEVPCCGGIAAAAMRGLALAGKSLPLREVVVGIDGEIRDNAGGPTAAP